VFAINPAQPLHFFSREFFYFELLDNSIASADETRLNQSRNRAEQKYRRVLLCKIKPHILKFVVNSWHRVFSSVKILVISGFLVLLVEPGGIEPPSESILT